MKCMKIRSWEFCCTMFNSICWYLEILRLCQDSIFCTLKLFSYFFRTVLYMQEFTKNICLLKWNSVRKCYTALYSTILLDNLWDHAEKNTKMLIIRWVPCVHNKTTLTDNDQIWYPHDAICKQDGMKWFHCGSMVLKYLFFLHIIYKYIRFFFHYRLVHCKNLVIRRVWQTNYYIK